MLMADDFLSPVLAREMPVALGSVALSSRRFGLVVVDEVNGFATVGAGPLAPAAPNAQVTQMVAEADRLARAFLRQGAPVLAFLDSHDADRPEPPYPPHCVIGTGQEQLVPALAWLDGAAGVTLMRKDCINGFVGGIGADGRNKVVDWVNAARLDTVVVVGICTDICVMDFVLTFLSARNHGLMPPLRDIVVYEPGCATYDLPAAAVSQLGLPPTAAHPQGPAHHLGLYFMASRGAVLANHLSGL